MCHDDPRSRVVPSGLTLVVTCEHASDHIPRRFAHLFAHERSILRSHRAVDEGAERVARRMGRLLGVEVIFGGVSRLLIDLNRTEDHPRIVSEYSRDVDRELLLATYHRPHWSAVRARIERGLVRRRWVLHIGVHSFVDQLEGKQRNADIGLLYDPKREAEKRFCAAWKRELTGAPALGRVRLNYPYRGVSNGLTTAMRRLFPERYLGIELELNQAWLRATERDARRRDAELVAALERAAQERIDRVSSCA